MPLKLPKSKQNGVAYSRAPKQERSRAKELGGKRVIGSGSLDEKGDIRLKGIARLELKNTTKKSFSITQKMVEKIESAAISSGEIPAIEVEFIDENGKLLNRVAVMPSYALDMLLGNNE
jgi:hypothetical protein